MLPTQQGSFHLFRLAGISVFLHWSWFLAAAYFLGERESAYPSLFWNLLKYLALFLIVLLHEFGHALACRQVGGHADMIVLWPLGGVAYVAPPHRPGATLWSIAAGPLVNLVLFPVLTGAWLVAWAFGLASPWPNLNGPIQAVWTINLGLLIFNLLPIYPLDGGQILRSILWFFIGPARSLMVTALVGFVGVAGLIAFALWVRDPWLGVMSAFILMNCWRGLMHARVLAREEALTADDRIG